MATTQLGLIPAYRTVPFGPGWWSYSFPYAATAGNAIIWLGVEHTPDRSTWTYLLLAAITAFIGWLAIRTIIAVAHHRFLPRQVLGAVGPSETDPLTLAG